MNVAMADGELTPCLGWGKLQIKINNTKDDILHDVYLANIEPEGILDMTFCKNIPARWIWAKVK